MLPIQPATFWSRISEVSSLNDDGFTPEMYRGSLEAHARGGEAQKPLKNHFRSPSCPAALAAAQSATGADGHRWTRPQRADEAMFALKALRPLFQRHNPEFVGIWLDRKGPQRPCCARRFSCRSLKANCMLRLTKLPESLNDSMHGSTSRVLAPRYSDNLIQFHLKRRAAGVRQAVLPAPKDTNALAQGPKKESGPPTWAEAQGERSKASKARSKCRLPRGSSQKGRGGNGTRREFLFF